jgi:hypothetical protein
LVIYLDEEPTLTGLGSEMEDDNARSIELGFA